jgi:hypothetical protein
MPLHLTPRQRRKILRYVRDHAVDGACPDEPQFLAGVDVGYALLTMEGEGLCVTEDPHFVWLTPEGEKMIAEVVKSRSAS